MDSASTGPAEEHWNRGVWLVFAMADETRQPQSVTPWLPATQSGAGRRHRQANAEGPQQ